MELLPNYTNLSEESKISSTAERGAIHSLLPTLVLPLWIVPSISEPVSHSVNSQIAKGWNALAT